VSVGVQPLKPKATRKRLKKEILSDDFKKRKIFWKNIAENFSPHITMTLDHISATMTYVKNAFIISVYSMEYTSSILY
jgi:hypothetical protein